MTAPLARLSVLAALVLALPGRGADDAVQFNRDIRPIMSDTCFHCHGFDAKSRKGGLRLDLREEALKARAARSPSYPGNPTSPRSSSVSTRRTRTT
jgi:hypothetical protein